MIPNPWSSCLHLPSARIIGIATTSFRCSAGDGTTPPDLPHTHFWELLIVSGTQKMALLASLLYWVFQHCYSKWQNSSSMRMARWTWLSSLLINRSVRLLEIKMTILGWKLKSINIHSYESPNSLLSINVPENGSKERTLQQSQSKSCNASQTLR